MYHLQVIFKKIYFTTFGSKKSYAQQNFKVKKDNDPNICMRNTTSNFRQLFFTIAITTLNIKSKERHDSKHLHEKTFQRNRIY